MVWIPTSCPIHERCGCEKAVRVTGKPTCCFDCPFPECVEIGTQFDGQAHSTRTIPLGRFAVVVEVTAL